MFEGSIQIYAVRSYPASKDTALLPTKPENYC